MAENCAVLRRMLFATSFLPPDLPLCWEIIARFANQEGASETAESVRVAMDNMRVLNNEAFVSDDILASQLINMQYDITKQSLGIPLVPNQTKCPKCGGGLALRSDRPSRLTLYTETFGTVAATHFHKYCRNSHKGCRFVQYYGYHKQEGENHGYDQEWESLPYFISTQETGFELKMLKKFDTELLIGQLSYNQKADIYNVANDYDNTKKTCSTTKGVKTSHGPSIHG